MCVCGCVRACVRVAGDLVVTEQLCQRLRLPREDVDDVL